MMFSTVVALFFLFLAFVITALEPRLTDRSARLALLRATDAVVPIDAVPASVDGYGAQGRLKVGDFRGGHVCRTPRPFLRTKSS